MSGLIERIEAAGGPDRELDRLRKAETLGKQQGKIALYFGCWDRSGHYLHHPGGGTLWEARRDYPHFPWSLALLDTGLLKNGKHADVYDGRVYWTLGGRALWHAFFWWDRSVDQRGASNSGFYVRGFGADETQKAFDYACGQFPKVVARQKHPLIPQGIEAFGEDADAASSRSDESPVGVADAPNSPSTPSIKGGDRG